MSSLVRPIVLLNCGAKVRPIFLPSKHLTAILFAILCYGTMIINGLGIEITTKYTKLTKNSYIQRKPYVLSKRTISLISTHLHSMCAGQHSSPRGGREGVFFNHCYSNCYSILEINQLSGFIASLSHNNPYPFRLILIYVGL